MLFIWKNTESMQEPLLVDDKSSSYGLYLRKDVVQENNVYKYKEIYLSNDYKMNIVDVEEYQEKLLACLDQEEEEYTKMLHITKLDFYNNLCKPANISYDTLMAKITELGMKTDWELCNHVYYGIIQPFFEQLPLGKTEDEVIAIFEKLQGVADAN